MKLNDRDVPDLWLFMIAPNFENVRCLVASRRNKFFTRQVYVKAGALTGQCQSAVFILENLSKLYF